MRRGRPILTLSSTDSGGLAFIDSHAVDGSSTTHDPKVGGSNPPPTNRPRSAHCCPEPFRVRPDFYWSFYDRQGSRAGPRRRWLRIAPSHAPSDLAQLGSGDGPRCGDGYCSPQSVCPGGQVVCTYRRLLAGRCASRWHGSARDGRSCSVLTRSRPTSTRRRRTLPRRGVVGLSLSRWTSTRRGGWGYYEVVKEIDVGEKVRRDYAFFVVRPASGARIVVAAGVQYVARLQRPLRAEPVNRRHDPSRPRGAGCVHQQGGRDNSQVGVDRLGSRAGRARPAD